MPILTLMVVFLFSFLITIKIRIRFFDKTYSSCCLFTCFTLSIRFLLSHSMSNEFSEIDLSDHIIPTASIESPENIRARRKHFPANLKQLSNSPSSASQTTSLSIADSSFHEFALPNIPPPPFSLLDTSATATSSFNASRYPASTSQSSSPPPMTISSDSSSSSPKHVFRSSGSLDLTKRTFNFPISRHDSIIDSLLSAIYERDCSTYGLSSSQDSDTITTSDFTDPSIHPRRLSGDSMTNTEAIVLSKGNMANKSKLNVIFVEHHAIKNNVRTTYYESDCNR
jgi:hypothetical protein